jgi:hypothetical protein
MRRLCFARRVLKPYLCLLLLAAFACDACDPVNIEGLRKDVEEAFLSKSFLSIANKYGDAQRVRLILEDEYNEESPTMSLEFKSISELSTWFFEKHEYAEHMIIPSPVHCRGNACTYAAPELTLHHGVYLLGFETRKVGRSTPLTQLHIQWG